MRTGHFKRNLRRTRRLDRLPRRSGLWSAALVAALLAAPLVLSSYALSLVTIILITVVGALGLNMLTGYTGLISLGHVGFLVDRRLRLRASVADYHWPAGRPAGRRRDRRRWPASSSACRRCG